MAYGSAFQNSWTGIALTWLLAVALSILLAAVAMAFISGSFWLAGWCAGKIAPALDEHGRRLRGKAAWRHYRYRANVWFGHVSFFPYRADHSWKRIVRFHFIVMALMCLQEVFGILLNEGEPRPLHLSLLAFFLPSALMFSGAVFTRKSNARHGYPKRQGSGPDLARRYFSDEEIAERLRNERRHALSMNQYWERQRER
jgi:hypothetical protein